MQIGTAVRSWLKNSMRWWEGLSAKFASIVRSSSKGLEGLLTRLYLKLACILVVASTIILHLVMHVQ
jgi:hypothetical protein